MQSSANVVAQTFSGTLQGIMLPFKALIVSIAGFRPDGLD